jgi:hypothetical protein
VFRCRAPDAPPNPRLHAVVAGTAATQAAALTLPVTRALLGVAVSPVLALAGFAGGFVLPLAVARLREGELVVRARSLTTLEEAMP